MKQSTYRGYSYCVSLSIVLSVTLVLLLTLFLLPTAAFAAEVEPETINLTGMEINGVSGTGWNVGSGQLSITESGTYIITGSSNTIHIDVYENKTVNLTLNNVSLTKPYYSPLTIGSGTTASVTLLGTNTLTASGGGLAAVAVVGNLIITDTSTGSLTATGSITGAGIGGANGVSVGEITINGGTVVANGGSVAAGIGGGNYGQSGNSVTINGGTVTAVGGSRGGAGIGGAAANSGNDSAVRTGNGGDSGTITITGGTVIATGGGGYNIAFNTYYQGGAGIGGGYGTTGGNAEEITISGGTVTATGGRGGTTIFENGSETTYPSGAGIGGGGGDTQGGSSTSISISGSTTVVTASSGAGTLRGRDLGSGGGLSTGASATVSITGGEVILLGTGISATTLTKTNCEISGAGAGSNAGTYDSQGLTSEERVAAVVSEIGDLDSAVDDAADVREVIAATALYDALTIAEKAQVASSVTTKLTSLQTLSRTYLQGESGGDYYVSSGSLPWYVRLRASAVSSGSNYTNFAAELAADKTLVALHNVTLTDMTTSELYSPLSNITVRVKLVGITSATGLTLYHQKADDTLESVSFSVQSGYLVFTSRNFSLYGLARQVIEEEPDPVVPPVNPPAPIEPVNPGGGGGGGGVVVASKSRPYVSCSININGSSTAYGNDLVFVVSVLGNASVPTGAVTFRYNDKPFATSAVESGRAVATLKGLLIGEYALNVEYLGDDAYYSQAEALGTLKVTNSAAMTGVLQLISQLPDIIDTDGRAESVLTASRAYLALSENERVQLPKAETAKLLDVQQQTYEYVNRDNNSDIATVSGEIGWNAEFFAEKVDADSADAVAFANMLPKGKTLLALFDLNFVDIVTGGEYHPVAPIAVTLNSLLDLDTRTGIVLYHQQFDGTLRVVPVSAVDGVFDFYATNFSLYGIAADVETATPPIQPVDPPVTPDVPVPVGKSNLYLWVLIPTAAIVLTAAGVILYNVFVKRKEVE
jgi:hypothetical protein